MQWILQKFEDTEKLAQALDGLGIAYSWHKVIPFIGQLDPEPVVADSKNVVLFGSYSLWRMAEEKSWSPGVFTIEPFLTQTAWLPYLLNGNVTLMTVREAAALVPDDTLHFVRPVSDSKEIAGTVMTTAELVSTAAGVLTLREEEIPGGSLSHDTELLLAEPVKILKEWRCWVVGDEVVTWSLYKDGSRVIYRPEIDDDALDFARQMVSVNPGYSDAYVIDVCRTEEGLRIIETNCLNAAGFYAADLMKLALEINSLGSDSAAQ
ncbi:ATP-grasp domain-containing protein [Agrobacterium rubi]|nr:ATP-grasp domain-containing protein [Agrobacterium rubi]NTF24848.1 ATP-grasp domain-containing protein [Agrobacterium rubi]